MLIFVAVIATLFAVWNILRLFGVFEVSTAVNKVNKDVREEEKLNKKRDFERKKLGIYSTLTNSFRGVVMSDLAYEKHKYIIDRLEIRSKPLNRNLTPEELKGKYLALFILGVFCLILSLFYKIFVIPGALLIASYCLYLPRYNQQVRDEDDIIDTYFIDVYLLLYSKLRLGSKARLQTVVESYIDTLQVSTNLRVQEVMTKFAKFFLNNLAMYEDHEAVPHLRDRYKSATVVNFCNVASQALQGVDNGDALLSLKLDLTRRKTDIMKKNAERLRIRGGRAIYLIYVILFIFIAVGWYSKLPTNFF